MSEPGECRLLLQSLLRVGHAFSLPSPLFLIRPVQFSSLLPLFPLFPSLSSSFTSFHASPHSPSYKLAVLLHYSLPPPPRPGYLQSCLPTVVVARDQAKKPHPKFCAYIRHSPIRMFSPVWSFRTSAASSSSCLGWDRRSCSCEGDPDPDLDLCCCSSSISTTFSCRLPFSSSNSATLNFKIKLFLW